MKSLRILAILSLGVLTLGNRGCVTTDTIILPEGPRTTELSKTKDDQIATLQKQAADERSQSQIKQAEAAKAASSVKGILKANTYQPAGRPTEAINEEAGVALTRLPPDDPAETVKSLERAIQMIEGARDKALADYAGARHDSEVKQAEIAARDKELTQRDAEIEARNGRIVQLTDEANAERAAHQADVKKALDGKDQEIAQIKKDYESKERAAWVLWTRLAGLAFIVGGAVIAIVFHIVPEGAAFVGVGVAIGLVSTFIDWLTQQPFFPWLCGGAILVLVGIGGYALYRMWKKNTLQIKVTAALQDLKDESTTLGNDVWSKVSEHLDYRLGEKDGAAQKKLVASLGLVNPAAESVKDNPPLP